jgi:carbamoyl-phosphate synthase small subunit
MNDTSETLAAEAAALRARAVEPWADEPPTALLVLADGTVIEGKGAGAAGTAVGEVCFNTAMTGYQEILTDPSYAGQIITFTFPHVGNVGTNSEDLESASLAVGGVRGCVLRAQITPPSNWRAGQDFNDWLRARGIIAITGVDTRALTALIREKGMPNAVIAHEPDGKFDLDALKREAAAWPGMVGLDLAKDVTSGQSYTWDETQWQWGSGYGRQEQPRFHVVAIDYGLKRNILRELATAGCRLTVVPATATAEEILERARAIPRRPASMPCRRSRSSWIRGCRCSASASAIRCSAWRSAAAPARCIKAITGRTIP